MSVPVNKRTQGKLEVCVKAHDLCCYTLMITANKKIFAVEYQESVTNRIVDLALDIHTSCWAANNIVVKSRDEYAERSRLQGHAAVQCNIMLSMIEIAKKLFHLDTRRVVYWAEKTITTRNLIRGWRESDAKRYAQYRS